MSGLHERITRLEESAKVAHKRIDYVEEKKLSKHEFNGFTQLVENMKSTFLDSIKSLHDTSAQLSKSTSENTKAINNLQNTFDNIGKFMPILVKVVSWLGGIIVLLLGFIGGKLFGLW